MPKMDQGGATQPKPTTTVDTTVPMSGAAWEIFNTFLTNTLGPKSAPWIGALWKHGAADIQSETDLANSPITLDLILAKQSAKSDPALDSFRRMTAIVDDLKARKAKGEPVYIPTYYQFIETKQSYENTLNKYGLSGIANDTELEQMIASNVSPAEISTRIETAYDAVRYADSALKEQLKQQYPNLNDTDLVAGLLKGADGVKELERRVEVAGIKAEQSRFKMGLTYSAEELSNMGYNRAAVAEKLANLQDLAPSEQRLASLYGGETPQDVQTSLEREAFTGVTSADRKSRREKEAAAFAGASGLTSGSLSKRRAGRI